MIKKISYIGVLLLTIILLSAWVENKNPVVEIDSITPRGASNKVNWNALITIAGSVYDGLAIPGAYGGSGIILAQVTALNDKNQNDIADTGEGGYVQIGTNITTELQNATLKTWTGPKMGTRYRIIYSNYIYV